MADSQRRDRYATAIRAESSRVDDIALATAVMAVADAEQADLRTRIAQVEELLSIAHQTSNTSEAARAAAERIRENADFHLGQEMARRQRAEKETARLRADRAAVLREAADAIVEMRREFFEGELDPSYPTTVEQRALIDAEVNLRRMADEAQQAPEPHTPTAHYRRDDGVDCCVHTIPVGPNSCAACRELDADEAEHTPEPT
ncbi:hypothetical protein C9F11_38055 [Streptomyces sp. YIM 121038]|uniref:hypothetical protein n=1 Tax=Streptomyces sp. YIM 121038 TaxID=2136401 RepID=UPI0011101B9F|nr:hypothetical protein [Streptomyces sp. YIM 121038]QCX81194.1 hypothetical protein C9F11_38055 [Streptomyces sp. YIM 121038]